MFILYFAGRSGIWKTAETGCETHYWEKNVIVTGHIIQIQKTIINCISAIGGIIKPTWNPKSS